MRRTRKAAGSTCCPVKHPYGGFQKPLRPATGEIAPKHCIAGLADHRLEIDRSAEPGRPWIKNLAPVGNLHVLAFICTTRADPILQQDQNLQSTDQGWSRLTWQCSTINRFCTYAPVCPKAVKGITGLQSLSKRTKRPADDRPPLARVGGWASLHRTHVRGK